MEIHIQRRNTHLITLVINNNSFAGSPSIRRRVGFASSPRRDDATAPCVWYSYVWTDANKPLIAVEHPSYTSSRILLILVTLEAEEPLRLNLGSCDDYGTKFSTRTYPTTSSDILIGNIVKYYHRDRERRSVSTRNLVLNTIATRIRVPGLGTGVVQTYAGSRRY